MASGRLIFSITVNLQLKL